MREVLLTGATGLIGGEVVRLLAARNRVWATTRLQQPPPGLPGCRWIQMDLSGPLQLAKLPERVDAVIHLAQSRRFREFPEGAEDVHRVNVTSTLQLLEYARTRGATSFVYASSGGVIGHKEGPIVESDTPCPGNFYQLSKLHGEQIVRSYGEHLSTVILRYFFVYGPGQKGMLVPNLCQAVRSGQPVKVYNGRGVHLNPIHVCDAALATVRALELSGTHLLNVAGPEVVSIAEMAARLGRLLGREPQLVEANDANVGDLVADIEMMRRQLGLQPQTTLSQGLREMLEAPCQL